MRKRRWADGEVYGDNSRAWEGGFPDFETELGWEVGEASE